MKSFFRRTKRVPNNKINEVEPVRQTTSQKEPQNDVFRSVSRMKTTVENLTKRQTFLETKCENFLKTAAEHKRKGRTSDALACLKRKKLVQDELSKLSGMIFNLEQQIITLESSNTTKEMLAGQMEYRDAMKKLSGNLNADSVADLQDSITEQINTHEEISDLLADTELYDVADCEEELDNLLREDEEILSQNIHTVQQPSQIVDPPQSDKLELPEAPTGVISKEDEEDNKELDKLLAEMEMN